MKANIRKLRKSVRGLTFALENTALIGTRYRYQIEPGKKTIRIVPDENGDHTISRKKCGNRYKALVDIRSVDVRELVTSADYLEIEEQEDRIVVRVYRKAASNVRRPGLYLIDNVLCEKAAEIILPKGEDFRRFAEEMNEPARNIAPYYVASLFSGAGLLDKPFRDDSRCRIVYATDFDPNACETYAKNISDVICCKDIREVDAEEVPDNDLVIGGPCCQAYSNSNRHNLYTEEAEGKRLLLDDYIRIVRSKKPEAFVIENVPTMLTFEGGIALEKLREKLPEYRLSVTKLKDTDIGGFTKRIRAIIIGCLHTVITLPEKAAGAVRTVRDALKKVTEEWFNCRDYTIPGERTKQLMSYVPQGGNWRNIPPEVCYFPPTTHSQRYYRLKWDEPAPTITNFRKPNITHPEENRIISVSEAAALMGLEEDFRVYGKTLDSRQQQVSNGVTQAMAGWIRDHVLSALDKLLAEGLFQPKASINPMPVNG